MTRYNKESLKTDIEWLAGYNMDRKEAEQFIKSLLKAKPTFKLEE